MSGQNSFARAKDERRNPGFSTVSHDRFAVMRVYLQLRAKAAFFFRFLPAPPLAPLFYRLKGEPLCISLQSPGKQPGNFSVTTTRKSSI
jgi:hypothetical protein